MPMAKTKKKGRTTCAVGKECGSGNRTCQDAVSFHRFPPEEDLRELWIAKIRRNDWTWTEHSRLCSKHFLPTDYTDASEDTNKSRRKRKNKENIQKRKKLKNGAVPSIFPYTQPSTPRPTKFTSAEIRKTIDFEKEQTKDRCETLADLVSKVNSLDLPANVTKISNIQDLSVCFLKIVVTDNPHIKYCVQIQTSLEYKIWFMGEEIVPYEAVPEPPSKMTSVSFLKRLLSALDQREEKEQTTEEKINEIITMLDDLPLKNRKLDFIQEQLSLLTKKPKGRRYSNELLAMACMWVHVSHALYKQIRLDNVITLPDDKYVKRLSSSLTVDFDLSEGTVEYLKMRKAKLLRKDLNINVIFDEIYSFATIQYTNGSFYGNEGDAITKTMLCVMLKSVAGGFRDVVTMAPITNISSEKIYEVWKNVVKKVTELSFNVVVTTIDIGYSI